MKLPALGMSISQYLFGRTLSQRQRRASRTLPSALPSSEGPNCFVVRGEQMLQIRS